MNVANPDGNEGRKRTHFQSRRGKILGGVEDGPEALKDRIRQGIESGRDLG